MILTLHLLQRDKAGDVACYEWAESWRCSLLRAGRELEMEPVTSGQRAGESRVGE